MNHFSFFINLLDKVIFNIFFKSGRSKRICHIPNYFFWNLRSTITLFIALNTNFNRNIKINNIHVKICISIHLFQI